MPIAPHQMFIATFELLMLLVGAWILARTLGVPELRAAVFGQTRLAHWHVSGFEAALLAVGIFLCGMAGQILAHQFLAPAVVESPDRAGLEIVIYGLGFHGVGLLAWPIFKAARRSALFEYGSTPPPATPPRMLGVRSVIWESVTALLLALPVLTLASAGWAYLLRQLGLPDEPQDLIGIFGAVKSPAVLVAMLFVACVVAPINEELLFRGVIFRFCRQRFGRAIALAVSGVLFGAMHGNWAGFVPLTLLGFTLALAYEHSGDIRVPIVAHALFNLNTTLVVLSGLPNAT